MQLSRVAATLALLPQTEAHGQAAGTRSVLGTGHAETRTECLLLAHLHHAVDDGLKTVLLSAALLSKGRCPANLLAEHKVSVEGRKQRAIRSALVPLCSAKILPTK